MIGVLRKPVDVLSTHSNATASTGVSHSKQSAGAKYSTAIHSETAFTAPTDEPPSPKKDGRRVAVVNPVSQTEASIPADDTGEKGEDGIEVAKGRE